MNFANALSNELLENYNESVTENGAMGYRTTGKELLDLNFAVASLRKKTDQEVVEMFRKAYLNDKRYAIKWLFFARDVRGGLGERRLFRLAMRAIAINEPNLARYLVGFIPYYGRFDDLLCLLGTGVQADVLKAIKEQIVQDIQDARDNKPISLLAKWLPSENASSKTTAKYAKIIRNYFGVSSREYRKMLSALRGYLDVVERRMSSKEWSEINYESVPSRANLIYNNAFLRNDEDRRRNYLDKLSKGEAKINSSVLYPHEIVHAYTKYQYGRIYSNTKKDPALEAMWKSLPDLVKGNGNTIVVADGSGSMTSSVDSKSGVRALDVANALAIYFAERCSGEFKNKYITFSTNPQLVDLKANSLLGNLSIALAHNECSNTNIEKVFDLILTTAINNHMQQSDMPANILIISDMEFDDASSQGEMWDPWSRKYTNNSVVNKKLFKLIEDKYKAAGYKLPRLVFWNVASRTGTIPLRENDMGVALVSGFSVNICKMVMSGELDPYKCLLETLDSDRYQCIENALQRATKELCEI